MDSGGRRAKEIRGLAQTDGGGESEKNDSCGPLRKKNYGVPSFQVLPSDAVWIKDSASSFDPANNLVRTKSGEELEYEYLVVAMGIQLNYHKVGSCPYFFDCRHFFDRITRVCLPTEL